WRTSAAFTRSSAPRSRSGARRSRTRWPPAWACRLRWSGRRPQRLGSTPAGGRKPSQFLSLQGSRAGYDEAHGESQRRRGGAPRRKPDLTRGVGAPLPLAGRAGPGVRFAAGREDGRWGITRAETEPDVRVAAVHGEVKSSLFEAIDDVGESPQLVMALVNIFEWDFDFTADTRTGDRFRLLVEKRYAGDRFVNYGRILVAQYVSNDRVISGVGFEAGGEGRYAFYDPDGRSLKKSFLKSPLEFSRITSRFTY